MMPFLMAALIAGLAAHSPTLETPLPLWPELAAVMGVSVVLWCALCLVMRAALLSRPHGRTLMRWEMIGQGLLLAWFAWICLGLGWPSAIPGTFLALVPFLVLSMVQWACLAAPIARVTGEHWTPASHITHQARFSALPFIIGLVLADDVASALLTYWLGSQSLSVEIARATAMAVITLGLAPPLLVRILGARPLPAGPLRERLSEACTAMGHPHAKLMRWSVPLPRFYNAMVVGALPRLRYVVFSDDLLRDLQDRELLAVLGHELGHSHHRHLWVYLVFLGSILAIGGMFEVLIVQSQVPMPEWAGSIPQAWREGLLAIVGLLFAYRVAFGMLSRACERQADLAGVRLSGDPEAMESALKTVARLSGQAETVPNWRHRSIAERVDYLRRVRAQPSLATDHHRHMRYSLVLLILIMVASLFTSWWLDPNRQITGPGDATAALDKWQTSDEELQQALALAEGANGNPTALGKWFQRASTLDRQRLWVLHKKLLTPDAKSPPGSKDPLVYQYKRRLSAFAGIDTGRPDFNLDIENTLAYGLAAGTTAPTPQDQEQAQLLLPNLESAVAKQRDHALFDTIGCVHFVLGHFDKARDAFANARNDLASDPLMKKPALAGPMAHSKALYARRLAAAERNVAASKSGDPLEPLPLDWTPPEPVEQPEEPAAPAPETAP